MIKFVILFGSKFEKIILFVLERFGMVLLEFILWFRGLIWSFVEWNKFEFRGIFKVIVIWLVCYDKMDGDYIYKVFLLYIRDYV